jgi:ABC-type uncharacterized transport system auxiliary subunit
MTTIATKTNRSIGILLLATLALAGCLSRPALQKQSFSFTIPAGNTNATRETPTVLGIRTVEVAPAYQGRLFVYRTADASYERDPYAEFFVSPADSVSHAFRNYFRESGLFQAVTESGSFFRPDLLAEIHVSQLYGDFRDLKQPAAVLRLRCAFFDAQPQTSSPRPMFQKSYARRIPFKTRTASALMDGWNEALKQILADVATDLKTAMDQRPPAER